MNPPRCCMGGGDTEAGRLEHTGEHTTDALSDVTIMEMSLL